MNVPSWLTFLIALLVILAILYLVGIRFTEAAEPARAWTPRDIGWCKDC